mmetsp:Transcript_19848/g.46150  ORF Transcript_19848/g.46150 Transcript_19848/m.46150 type:complete len:123 (-) Transcript_19848:197-565(-)
MSFWSFQGSSASKIMKRGDIFSHRIVVLLVASVGWYAELSRYRYPQPEPCHIVAMWTQRKNKWITFFFFLGLFVALWFQTPTNAFVIRLKTPNRRLLFGSVSAAGPHEPFMEQVLLVECGRL